VRHFVPVARSWVEARRTQHELILVTPPHTDSGPIRRRLEEAFAARPDQDEWIDRVEFLGH
jgi:hypothetical protein